MVTECRQLEAYRLAKDFNWEQLSASMKRRRTQIPPRTLEYLCKRAPEGSCPRDRTLWKIRIYLSWARKADPDGMRRAAAIAREQMAHEQQASLQQSPW